MALLHFFYTHERYEYIEGGKSWHLEREVPNPKFANALAIAFGRLIWCGEKVGLGLL